MGALLSPPTNTSPEEFTSPEEVSMGSPKSEASATSMGDLADLAKDLTPVANEVVSPFLSGRGRVDEGSFLLVGLLLSLGGEQVLGLLLRSRNIFL